MDFKNIPDNLLEQVKQVTPEMLRKAMGNLITEAGKNGLLPALSADLWKLLQNTVKAQENKRIMK